MDQASLQEQLDDVITLLQDDPENEAFVELKKTLEEALESFAQSSSVTQESAAKKQNAEQDIVAVPARMEKHPNFDSIRTGARCEALVNNIWIGVVLETPEIDNKVTIKYIFDGSQHQVGSEMVRPIKIASKYDRTMLRVGESCQARYSGDGKLYDAIVMQVTSNGCLVRFNKYNNQEEVAFEHLVINEQARDQRDASLSDAIASVPRHLQISDTDTDKERERKRHKLRELKKQTKMAKRELEQEKKQEGWKAFQKTMKKRR